MNENECRVQTPQDCIKKRKDKKCVFNHGCSRLFALKLKCITR